MTKEAIITKNVSSRLDQQIKELLHFKSDVLQFIFNRIPLMKIKRLRMLYPEHIILNYAELFLANYKNPAYAQQVFKKYKINLEKFTNEEVTIIQDKIISCMKELFESDWINEDEQNWNALVEIYKQITFSTKS